MSLWALEPVSTSRTTSPGEGVSNGDRHPCRTSRLAGPFSIRSVSSHRSQAGRQYRTGLSGDATCLPGASSPGPPVPGDWPHIHSSQLAQYPVRGVDSDETSGSYCSMRHLVSQSLRPPVIRVFKVCLACGGRRCRVGKPGGSLQMPLETRIRSCQRELRQTCWH